MPVYREILIRYDARRADKQGERSPPPVRTVRMVLPRLALVAAAVRAAAAQDAPANRYAMTDNCPYAVGQVVDASKWVHAYGGFKAGAQFEALSPHYLGHDIALLNEKVRSQAMHFDQFPGWYVVDAGQPTAMVRMAFKCSGRCPAFLVDYTDDPNPNWSPKTKKHPKGYKEGPGRRWTNVADSRVVTKQSGAVSWPSAGCHRFWRFRIKTSTWKPGPYYWGFTWFGAAQTPTATWKGAQHACLADGKVLAAGHSAYDYKEMAAALRSDHQSTAWIGASDLDVEGKWTWADGSSPFIGNWNPHEPNGGKGESCGQVYAKGKMNDLNCNKKLPVLCMGKLKPPRVDSTYPAFSVSAVNSTRVQNQRKKWVYVNTWANGGYHGEAHGFEFDVASGRFTAHCESLVPLIYQGCFH